MKKHRVLIIEDDTLFSNGVKTLLARQKNLEIIGATSGNIQNITAEIERTQPNAIIINDNLSIVHPHLILNLFKTYPTLRIITLSLTNSHANIYDNRAIIVTTVDDLVTVITDTQ